MHRGGDTYLEFDNKKASDKAELCPVGIYILKQWIALKVRSDWLLRLQTSFAIDL